MREVERARSRDEIERPGDEPEWADWLAWPDWTDEWHWATGPGPDEAADDEPEGGTDG
jgi:hypothetical protein